MDFLTVLVPRSDYTIEDVWDVVGLRGTVSNDILVESTVSGGSRSTSRGCQAGGPRGRRHRHRSMRVSEWTARPPAKTDLWPRRAPGDG
ncbi:hypothetical protein SHIRM173S_12582 [Streptomyces hirsutus]